MTLKANPLVSSTPKAAELRCFPADGGMRTAKFGGAVGAPTLAILTPVAFDKVNNNYRPWGAPIVEQQSITVDATGGTFRLIFEGLKTAPIAFNASAAAVLAALLLLPAFDAGDLAVTGGPGDAGGTAPYLVNFQGRYLGENVSPITSEALADEVQSIAVDATGGTFTITHDGQTTAAIAFDATAAQVKTALEILPGFDADDLVVTGGPGDSGGTTPYVFTFQGRFAGQNVAALTTNAGSLTGGAGTAAVTTTTAGASSTLTGGAGTAVVADTIAAVDDGRSDIVGFLWPDALVLDATLEKQAVIMTLGRVHASDVALPAGEVQGTMDDYLRGALGKSLTQAGLIVEGISNLR